MVGRWIPQEQGSYSQCGEPSDSTVSQMWEVAIVNGRQGQGGPKERGIMSPNPTSRLPVLGYQWDAARNGTWWAVGGGTAQ